ncbi:MAG TPA: PAS domain S-box protein, partial [Pirellulales bacterium]|nr:PAS domain S-box protein [Pirellulales bacterium]
MGNSTRPAIDKRAPDPRPTPALKAWSRALAGTVVIIACVVLAGWASGLSGPTSIRSGSTMKVNAAIAFLLAGLSLWALIPESRSSRRSLAGQLSALAVLVIGVATYTEYLTGWDLGIDELFVNDSSIGISAVFPGRMALGSAVLFVVFGAILGLLDYERAKGPIQALTLIAMGATTLPPVGYFYGVNSLYQIPPYGSMALQTAAAFVVLGVGILIARPDRGVMIILTSDTPGGFLTRRLLPAAIAIPLVIGWFVAQGQHAGALNVEARLTLVTLANVAVFLGLAYWCGVLLHRAELQRNQSDLKFRLAVESAPNGTVMIDEDGRIVLINTQTERMFGYDRSELTGQKVELLVPERFRAQHPDRRSDFFANPVVRSMGAGRELFGLRKDGSEFPVEIGLTPIKTDEGLLVLSAIVDITERKRTEQAVQQSAERFQALVNAAAQIVWTTDAEGTALDDSPSWRAFTGQTYAEYRSTGWLNALHPDDCPQVVELWRRAVAGKSPYHSEHRIRHVSGEWRWTVARGMPLLDPNGLVRGWVGMN